MAVKTVKPKPDASQKGSAKTPLQKPSAPTPGEQPFNVVEYFKGVRQEWQRVTWPSKPQVIAETGVVLVVVTLFSLFVFLVDKIFQFLIQIIT